MGGPCGCAEMSIERAWRLRDGTVLALDEYHGCKQCHQGIGVMLYFFPSERSEWLEDAVIENAPTPNQYGGNNGLGISVDLLEVQDLVAALPIIEETCGSITADDGYGYATIEDWLTDNGIHLIRQAFTMRAQRLRQEQPPPPP